ncbi:hypothetical protein, partial [Pseudomonas sp. 2822-17]|uniref:hypothetical protein n=1 Tax=Pseudomonas sp. 2822-17 TaxID=1712678 RepID=UPI000C449CE8
MIIHIVIKLLFLFAAYKWGDWEKWEKYYPTILFFIIGDLLYNFLFYNYPMWLFNYGDDGGIPTSFIIL